MNPKFIFSLIVCSILLSCKKNNSGPQSLKQDGLWPMNIGNEWHYTTTWYNDDGSIEKSAEEHIIIEDTVWIQGVLYFYGGTYYTNLNENRVSTRPYTNALPDDSFAVVFQRPLTDTTIVWRIEQGSCNALDRQYKAIPGTTNINGYECLKNELVTYFPCDGTIMGNEISYLKPGLGLVRYEEYVKYVGYDTAYLRLTRDLTSYKLVE